MDSSQIRHNNVLSILNIIRQFFEVDHQCHGVPVSPSPMRPVDPQKAPLLSHHRGVQSA